MKKIIAVLLAALMTLTLFACGKSADVPADGAAAAETAAATVSDTNAGTPAPETTKAPETTTAPHTTAVEAETPEAGSSAETEAELPEWDYGERFEVSENGDVFTVRLPANATTGYSWSYKIWDESQLELLTDEYIEAPHAEGIVGAGGAWVASFRITTENDGKNYVNFYYSRGDQEIPDYVADVYYNNGKIWETGEHVNKLGLYEYEDGEFDEIELNFVNMFEENELSFYATADVVSPMVLSNEEFAEVTLGDTFTGHMYGSDTEVSVVFLEKIDDSNWRINDDEMFSYNKAFGGWIITGFDDDILLQVEKTINVHFTNETHIEDQMEQVLKTGNSGTIYDKMHDYHFVSASLKVKDGTATEITIFYHP